MTVEEILRASGLTEEQIKAIDAKVAEGFGRVLTTAEQAQATAKAAEEAAQLAQRAQTEMYEKQIAPALDNWATEKANLSATAAFYRAQNEEARKGGFVPADAPGYVAPTDSGTQRNAAGQFVAGQNPVPGSPQFLTQDQAFRALSNVNWVTNEHFRLFGTPPPDDIEVLLKEAADNKFDLRTHAARKYKFDEKKAEVAAAAQKKHDDAIRTETTAAVLKAEAEKRGSNPNINVGAASQYAQVRKAVTAGERKDPLTMTREQRHQATNSAIQKEIVENVTVQ